MKYLHLPLTHIHCTHLYCFHFSCLLPFFFLHCCIFFPFNFLLIASRLFLNSPTPRISLFVCRYPKPCIHLASSHTIFFIFVIEERDCCVIRFFWFLGLRVGLGDWLNPPKSPKRPLQVRIHICPRINSFIINQKFITRYFLRNEGIMHTYWFTLNKQSWHRRQAMIL